ncbi:MAG: holo-ACP synthase [Actinomycetota bacterium]
MSIYMAGVDIIEVERIRQAANNSEAFLNRVFTPDEVQYCRAKGKQMYPSLASRFAAKEAAAKSMGKGFGKDLSLKEIEIKNKDDGSPYVVLHGRAKEIAEKLGIKEVKLSLSATNEYAVAFSVSIKA